MTELKTYKMVDEKYCTDCVCVIPSEVYLKSEVDAVITELKDEIKRKERVQQRWFERCMEARTENRKLKRALYKACANWADLEVFDRTVGIDDPNVEANRWALMRNRCLKKAEEYK